MTKFDREGNFWHSARECISELSSDMNELYEKIERF